MQAVRSEYSGATALQLPLFGLALRLFKETRTDLVHLSLTKSTTSHRLAFLSLTTSVPVKGKTLIPIRCKARIRLRSSLALFRSFDIQRKARQLNSARAVPTAHRPANPGSGRSARASRKLPMTAAMPRAASKRWRISKQLGCVSQWSCVESNGLRFDSSALRQLAVQCTPVASPPPLCSPGAAFA